METDGRFDRFTERARKALRIAEDEARQHNGAGIETEHLLLGLISEGDNVAAKVLSNIGVELAKVRSAIEIILGREGDSRRHEVTLDSLANEAVELAVDEARRLGHQYIGTEHLLIGVLQVPQGIAAEVLASVGVTVEKVRTEITKILTQAGSVPARGLISKMTVETAPSVPNDLGIDLTSLAAAKRLDPVIGRNSEIDGVIQALCGRLRRIPVLLGERGVGKSAVVRGLALRIAAGDVPEQLVR